MTNSHMWTKYWQADRTASCFDSQGGNYEGVVNAFWQSVFAATPKNGKCLDLCTGNGAVPLIGAAASKNKSLNLDITGVDQADIDPSSFVTGHQGQYDGIRFMGGANVENLPFDDASFGLVTSQFGVEYTSLPKTLKSAVRILKPSGKLCFVMHAKEGSVKAASAADVDECRFLLDQSRLFQISEKTLKTLADAEGPGRTTQRKNRIRIGKAVKEFEAAINTVKEREALTRSPMHANAWRVCLDTINKRQHFPLNVLVAKIAETRLEAAAHKGRLGALVKASQSQGDMDSTMDIIAKLGLLNITREPLVQQETNNLIGWVVMAEKPAT